MRLNNIANPDRIYEGQLLVIRPGTSGGSSGDTVTYVVQRGDNLTSIANRYGTTVSELVRLNNIANPDRIYEGQLLVIRPGSCNDTYVVRRGDTLSAIAARYGTTVARLAGINGISNADRIYVGQVLDLGLC